MASYSPCPATGAAHKRTHGLVARPKSISLATSRLNMTFSGLMSRWTMSCSCKYATATEMQICAGSRVTSLSYVYFRPGTEELLRDTSPPRHCNTRGLQGPCSERKSTGLRAIQGFSERPDAAEIGYQEEKTAACLKLKLMPNRIPLAELYVRVEAIPTSRLILLVEAAPEHTSRGDSYSSPDPACQGIAQPAELPTRRIGIPHPKNMPGQGIQLCAGYERLRGFVLHARPRMLELGEDLHLRRELPADFHGPNLPWHGLPECCTDVQTEDQEDSVGPSAMP